MTPLCVNCRAAWPVSGDEILCPECFDIVMHATLKNIFSRPGNMTVDPTTGFITWDDEVTKKIDLNDLFKDKPKPEKNLCYPHHWIKYQGLNEQFYFCKYCDIRSDKP